MTIPLYIQGADLPDLALTWQNQNGDTIDYTSGWTFQLRIGTTDAGVLTKTTGITGAATAPNVTVAWTIGELDDLDPGVHTCDLIATRIADSKDRLMRFKLRVIAAVPAAS